jgi:hypothetical protein
MNTHTIQWQAFKRAAANTRSVETWQASEPLLRATRFSSRLLLALAPALAIVVASAWAVGAGLSSGILQALIWASGFVFLALAMETRKPDFSMLLITGLTLPALALLSAWVAVEFALLAAVLVAAWVAGWILQKAWLVTHHASRVTHHEPPSQNRLQEPEERTQDQHQVLAPGAHDFGKTADRVVVEVKIGRVGGLRLLARNQLKG